MLQRLPTPVATSVGVTVVANRDGQVSKPVVDDVAHDRDGDYFMSPFFFTLSTSNIVFEIIRPSSFWLVIVAVVWSVRFVLQQPQQHRRCRHRLAE